MSLSKTNHREDSTCIYCIVEEEIRTKNTGSLYKGCYGTNQRAADPSVMTIKVLGSGRRNCTMLFENVSAALEEMNLKVNLIKVTDYLEIIRYGIKSTPALVVNEKVVSCGRILEPKEVIELLEKEDRFINYNSECCCA